MNIKTLLEDEEIQPTFQSEVSVKGGGFWEAGEVCRLQDAKTKRVMIEEIEKSGIAPRNHDLEYYVNEVGQRESKHLPNCELCKWQEFKKWALGE